MKIWLVFMISLTAGIARSWTTLDEMENEICFALTNDTYLLSEAFTNKLNEAASSPLAKMRCEAYMILSINAYQHFRDTVDESWLGVEMQNASNAVVAIVDGGGEWQYWASRFIYASAYASISDYSKSFSVLTNAITEMVSLNYTNSESCVERAIIEKFEMPGLEVESALKVFAGMSAACLGMGNVATNYANQVPLTYRNMIFEFLR